MKVILLSGVHTIISDRNSDYEFAEIWPLTPVASDDGTGPDSTIKKRRVPIRMFRDPMTLELIGVVSKDEYFDRLLQFHIQIHKNLQAENARLKKENYELRQHYPMKQSDANG